MFLIDNYVVLLIFLLVNYGVVKRRFVFKYFTSFPVLVVQVLKFETSIKTTVQVLERRVRYFRNFRGTRESIGLTKENLL
jgi:hypothetical protein